jgi:hypothetical protein
MGHMTKCECDDASMMMVQYQGTSQDYDGISEYKCTICGNRVGRWSGKILVDGELEKRWG